MPDSLRTLGESGEASPSLHVNIISWGTYAERAALIARDVIDVAQQVSIVYSHDRPPVASDCVQLVETSAGDFFGRKFHKAIGLNVCEVMLQIQADAVCDDWSALVKACREDFNTVETLAVWGPNVSWTPYPTELVRVETATRRNGLVSVVQTDGIVWALRAPVIERLGALDYSANNLGWGIDWCAVCFAYANSWLVARNLSHVVSHEKARGYDGRQAAAEMRAFLKQQTPRESMLRSMFVELISARRPAVC